MSEENKARFGDRLRAVRENRKLSQEELGNMLGTSKQVISRYELNKRTPKVSVAAKMSDVLGVSLAYLLGDEDSLKRDTSNIIPYVQGRSVPIIGSIPAGSPVLAVENIVGHDYADVPEGEDYFYLRVSGDSMINAGINSGDLVLIKMQPCAENGQIVACMINGEEATLKRYYNQKDTVILQPENPAYQPIVVPCKDFESGYARIIGVAKEVKRKL